MPEKVAKTSGSSKTQPPKKTTTSSSSKSSGSSKTSSSSNVKKATPPPAKPKNVDKVDFGKPKPTASAGVYKPAPPKHVQSKPDGLLRAGEELTFEKFCVMMDMKPTEIQKALKSPPKPSTSSGSKTTTTSTAPSSNSHTSTSSSSGSAKHTTSSNSTSSTSRTSTEYITSVPSAHSSASKTFTATHSKPFTAPQPETTTFKVTSSYNEGTTMQFVGQGDEVHFPAPPKDAVKECFKMLHSSDAVERNRIKTQAQMVLLPNAISQANKAYDNLCKAADEYFQVATEIEDKTQDVPDRLEGKTTREKVSTTGRTALGVGLEAVVELIHGGSVTPEGIIIGAALGKFARDVERAIEVCVDLVECTEALERVTKNLNKSAEQFNKKIERFLTRLKKQEVKWMGKR